MASELEVGKVKIAATDGQFGLVHENASGIKVGTDTNTTIGFIGTISNHPLKLMTNNGGQVTIDTTGHVAIADDKYYQWGGTNARIVGSHSGDYVKILTGNSAKLTVTGSGQTTITASDTNVLYVNRTTSNGDAIVVESGGNDRIRIGTAGITFPNGGTAPTAAAANQLDYYEEGTFTPTLSKDNFSTTISSPDVATGRYVRVGKMCYIIVYWHKTACPTTTGGSAYKIGALPFSFVQDSPYQFLNAGYVIINGSSYDTSSYRWQVNDASALTLYGTQSATNWTTSLIEFSACGVLEIA